MKVEIDDKLVNLDISVKAEIKRLKVYIKKLECKVNRQNEDLRQLRWKAGEVEDLKTQLEEIKRKIKDFFDLGAE